MPKTLSCFIVLAALSAALAKADVNTVRDQNSSTASDESSEMGRGKSSTGRIIHPDSGQKNPLDVRGVCVIEKSPSNVLGGPCVNLTLVFSEIGGSGVIEVRTGKDGKFVFSANPDSTYKVAPGSSAYVVSSSASPFRAGDSIRVRLQLK